MNLARAAELILFLWFPVFISNQRLTSQTLMLTDLLGLALTITTTVLLVGFTRPSHRILPRSQLDTEPADWRLA